MFVKIICSSGVLYLSDPRDKKVVESFVSPRDDRLPGARGFYARSYTTPAQEAAWADQEVRNKFFKDVDWENPHSLSEVRETLTQLREKLGEVVEVKPHPAMPGWVVNALQNALEGKEPWELQIGELPKEKQVVKKVGKEEVLVSHLDRWGREIQILGYNVDDPRIAGKQPGDEVEDQ